MGTLHIYKNDATDRLAFISNPGGEDCDISELDDKRVVDLMMWLQNIWNKKNPREELEFEIVFTLMECKMIRDFLTNAIDEYERLDSI